MNRTTFESLRCLPDKKILDDILFKKENTNTLSFDNVKVHNSMGIDLLLNGKYKPNIPSVRFNFYIRGTGPICRIEINRSIHGESGRTHKHSLQKENCPRRNLPFAKAREDLQDKDVTQLWEIICQQAKVKHEGTFAAPNE